MKYRNIPKTTFTKADISDFAHNLLSASHSDTLSQALIAGDIIIANATPKWSRLAKGTNGQVLKLVAGSPAWSNSTSLDSGTAAGQMLFWDAANSKWTYTSTSELVWDDVSKRLGINFNNPTVALEVDGGARFWDDVQVNTGGGTSAFSMVGNADLNLLVANSSGNDKLGIGIAAAAEKLDVVGNIKTNGYLTDGTNTATPLQCKTAYDHSQVTHDYSYITGNDGATDVTAAELETLTDTSNADALHVHNLDYTNSVRTDCTTFEVGLSASATWENLLTYRPWQDETVLPAGMIVQVDIPRNITIGVRPQVFTTMTGTVTINGLDADGVVISEVFTINDAFNNNYTGDKAFSIVTSIVADQTDITNISTYSVGVGGKFGFENYPFNSTSDVFKVARNGADIVSTNYTVNATYGTVISGIFASSVFGDWITVWRRYGR